MRHTVNFSRILSAVVAAGVAAVVFAGPVPVASAAERPVSVALTSAVVTSHGDTLAVRYNLTVDFAVRYPTTTFSFDDSATLTPVPATYIKVNPGVTCTPDTANYAATATVTCDGTAPLPTKPGTYIVWGAFAATSGPTGTAATVVAEYTVSGGPASTSGNPDTWTTTQWCAESVRIVREVPGKGRTKVWGTRVQAGNRVTVDEHFAHEVGTSGDVSCQQNGDAIYRAVGNYAQVNAVVWGKPTGLHGTNRAPKGTRPGVYRYTAVATAVACQLAEGTVVIRCTDTPVVSATSTYKVQVRRNGGIKWNADDQWGHNTLPKF